MALRRVASRSFAVLLGTLLGLALGEVGLRLAGFEEELARQRTVFDPEYGTVRADSWVFDFHAEPGAPEVRLREQTLPIEPADGELRMLFIGDSGTEGVRVSLEDTYPLALQRILDEERPGHPVRAVNAGVFGMTTIDELTFLESRLLPLEPDVVVLGLFMANDINFNLGHTERLRTVEPTSSLGRELVDRSALAHFLYLRGLALSSRHGWLRDGDVARESVVARDLGLVDSRGLHMLSYPLGEIATYVQPESTLVAHAYEVLHTVLWRMKRLGRAHGFRLRVLLIPTPSTVAGRLTLLHYPNIREDLRDAGIDLQDARMDFGGPTRRVLAICDELDLPCLDPAPRMREIGMEVFFEDDEHPTVVGHAVLARELAESYDLLVAD